MFKFSTIALASVLLLTGCATPATQSALNDTVRGCQLGYENACEAIPELQEQANAEAATNGQIAALVVLLPLAILAGAHGGGGPGPGFHHGPPGGGFRPGPGFHR